MIVTKVVCACVSSPASFRTLLRRPQIAIAAQAPSMSTANKPINNVLLIIAMQAEAEPIVEELGLKKVEESPYASPSAAQLSGRTAESCECRHAQSY